MLALYNYHGRSTWMKRLQANWASLGLEGITYDRGEVYLTFSMSAVMKELDVTEVLWC